MTPLRASDTTPGLAWGAVAEGAGARMARTSRSAASPLMRTLVHTGKKPGPGLCSPPYGRSADCQAASAPSSSTTAATTTSRRVTMAGVLLLSGGHEPADLVPFRSPRGLE